ncbi:Homeobox-leucine zipper protein HOX32, partial [Mucuna pruriens]
MNGFVDDSWSLMDTNGVEDVIIAINSSPNKVLGSNYNASMFSAFGGGVLEHQSKWADYGVDAYSSACLKASPYVQDLAASLAASDRNS